MEELDAARRFADRWLASLPDRPVGVPADPAALRSALGDLPDDGLPAAGVLDDLAAALEPGLVSSGGPRYFGFVTGGTLPVALAADWMVAAADQDAAVAVMSPAAAVVEEVAGGWVLDLLGLPGDAAVGFATGAQTANIACLAAARHALLAGVGHDVEADGLIGAPPVTVLLGAAAHATVVQALRLLGFGARHAVRVPTDAQGRLLPEELRSALAAAPGPVLVCAQAGQVNTGACDPLDEIAALVRAREHTWMHVDGAFGLWAAASPARRHLVVAADRADSWAVDAHKWLNVPYDSALTVVRDRAALAAAMSVSAPYLPLGDLDPSTRTLENSRRARGIPVYAALRALGRRGVADLVDRCCDLARRAADRFAAHAEVLNDVVLNQVLVRFPGVDVAQLARAVAEDGTCWVGTTVWDGAPALRFSVSNWSTTAADVDVSVDRILALAVELSGRGAGGPA
ncbi:pyridoxal phosphate-dependent decarboxylase family protein [Actinomycetospora termitidis]|uniref:Aminotransferase class V-fold PLP-dependent enzyme n=1 Tax=Actinomycetospora termitidis TaxID=3053470 RepID=A0ABT7M7Z4_9PSEU|nr:aminotransferase class V-fold PLP-dependent enzyme [Actinomycetospora sp. Odt1-22]MDL5156803.1 aminotransferase class V-fold PLP-dependent enzyme [Actinomycetospora sp. Odt1-22]